MKPGQNARYRVQCLYDPSEGAPYRGSFFSKAEIDETLRFAYLPSGSIWELKGETFVVVGEVNPNDWPAAIPQTLMPCEWPGKPSAA